MRLILVRHGEALHNRKGVIAGQNGCEGLTDRGKTQAEVLGRRLSQTGELADCAALFSSPLPRAQETARILLPHLSLARLTIEADLAELDPGLADGLGWADYQSRFGAFDLLTETERPFAPGGESWKIFSRRVAGLMSRLAGRWSGRTILAVTHSGVIMASLMNLFDIPRPGTGAQLLPAYVSLTEWHHVEGRWHLLRFNDSAHLSWPLAAP